LVRWAGRAHARGSRHTYFLRSGFCALALMVAVGWRAARAAQAAQAGRMGSGGRPIRQIYTKP
jgi:hypothetical protein